MAKKPKFYVVWRGLVPGVYESWEECEAQVKGYEGAVYKSFKTREEALTAELQDPADYIGTKGTDTLSGTGKPAPQSAPQRIAAPEGRTVTMPSGEVLKIIEHEAIAVDAACSKNPGPMEYRGVYLRPGKEIFHFGPIEGTNNIGEFLAIVHALAILEQKGLKMTIYSDSRNAINWVRRKQCKTTLARNARTEEVYAMIARAEAWLKAHRVTCPILKWETQEWGEIPADFGRK